MSLHSFTVQSGSLCPSLLLSRPTIFDPEDTKQSQVNFLQAHLYFRILGTLCAVTIYCLVGGATALVIVIIV